MPDFSSLTQAQIEILAMLFLGVVVGKALGVQSAILSGLLVVAVLAPANFTLMAASFIFLCMIAKGLSTWISWL